MGDRRTVLVIEDDASIRRGVCDALRFAGYEPSEASDGRIGLEAALRGGVDLVLLDILMPRMDGFEVLRHLREQRRGVPVIVLTALGEESDRVRGLRAGADDYVVKPFSATELLARVEAVLRRSPERARTVSRLTVEGGAHVDLERREVVLTDGRREVLSQREAELLEYLAAHAGRAVTRDELLERVWGIDPRGVHTRTVDMAVARLRGVLGDDAAEPRIIQTVRARGYMLSTLAATTEPASRSASSSSDRGAAKSGQNERGSEKAEAKKKPRGEGGWGGGET